MVLQGERMKSRIFLTAALLLLAMITSGQKITRSVISSYGSFWYDGFTYIASTAGETMVATFADNAKTYFLTQGFHQPPLQLYPDSHESNAIDIGPNPVVRDYLRLQFWVKDITGYTIELVNIVGIQLQHLKLDDIYNGQITFINMQQYIQGTYIIHIYSHDGKMIRTEKIQKL